MNFEQAVRSALSNYANFSSRALRSEYWYFVLFALLLNIATSIIDSFLFGANFGETGLFNAIVSLALLIPNLAVSVRRLHDLDRSGWWLLLWLIPIVGFIILLVWLCTKGTVGDNRFGPDPLDGPGAPMDETGQNYSPSSIPKVK